MPAMAIQNQRALPRIEVIIEMFKKATIERSTAQITTGRFLQATPAMATTAAAST